MNEVTCFDRAVKLLALRTHFEAELRAKLRSRGYPGQEVDETVERLQELRYLDETRAAAEFVATKRARNGWGLQKLEAELRRRGVGGEALHSALEDVSHEDEVEQALRAAEKYARRRDDRDAIGRHLARKGFRPRVILTVLERRPGGDDSEA